MAGNANGGTHTARLKRPPRRFTTAQWLTLNYGQQGIRVSCLSYRVLARVSAAYQWRFSAAPYRGHRQPVITR